MKKDLSWLILSQKKNFLVQVNNSGRAYISADMRKMALPFSYRISVREAKKKFPSLTRNEFAAAILAGAELTSDDWR